MMIQLTEQNVLYLLNVRDRKKLLQSGQEIQHQHLQSALVLGPKVGGKNILSEQITCSG